MNESLNRWREEFQLEPTSSFDRLVRGVVPLGALAPLSFGEVLKLAFEPEDAALDSAAAQWLETHMLGRIPETTTTHRWAAVLEEFFRGIAGMELALCGALLRRHHKRLRLWLRGFYEGTDRDPEGAYLQALALAQVDQTFSPLWRSLILGDERNGRDYRRIGILGFRKMREADGCPAADIHEGLLQALVEAADRPGSGETRWKSAMRSLFAKYPRSAETWAKRLAPLLAERPADSHARAWLSDLIPPLKRPGAGKGGERKVQPVPKPVTMKWIDDVRADPALCDGEEFQTFLERHRAYARASGDAEFLNKTFNNLAKTLIRAQTRAALAVNLMEEALEWAGNDPHNWPTYAQALDTAGRRADALAALWQARQRFPWNPFIRTELARLLGKAGDLKAAAGVYREATTHFPDDVVCRAGLGDLLIDLDEEDEAERHFTAVLAMDARNHTARGGLARVWAIQSARRRDEALRERARGLLQDLNAEGNADAQRRLVNFDEQWQRALNDPTVKFRREAGAAPARHATPAPVVAPQSTAERLGRAMIALAEAEHSEDAAVRAERCQAAQDFLAGAADDEDVELLPALVETRGLILLAGGNANAALAYFDEQVERYGRGAWLGVLLGRRRALLALGRSDGGADLPALGGDARFALLVAQVLTRLAGDAANEELRRLLLELYPLAARHLGEPEKIENPAQMLGHFLQARWFAPAGVASTADFDSPAVLASLAERVRATRNDTFAALANATLALAA